MRYGEIFKRAWRDLWTGGVWGYLVTWYLVFIALGVAIGVAFVLFVGIDALSTFGSVDPLADGAFPEFGARFLAAFGVLFLVILIVYVPLGIAFNGGLVFLTNERAEGRPAQMTAGWGAAFRFWPRVAPIDITIGFINFLLVIVGLLVVSIASFGGAGMMAFSEDPGSIFAGGLGLCCCGGAFYLVFILIGMIMQAWESMAARHAIIGGMFGMAALGEGFRTVRDNFKRVFLMALAFLGIGLAIAIVNFLITLPMDQLTYSDNAGVAAMASVVSLVYSFFSMFVSAALSIFTYAAWTHFFRDLTGIGPQTDGYRTVPPLPPLPVTPGMPEAPSAWAPPAPPAPPAMPEAPSAWAPPAPPASPGMPEAPSAWAPPAPPAPPAVPPVPEPPAPPADAPIVDVTPPEPPADA